MTMTQTILPPSSTPLERAVDRTFANRIAALTSIVNGLWSSEKCPVVLLPYLAWSVGVDEWDEAWSEEKKRSTIAEAPVINRTKGTRYAIRRALTALGQGDADIVDRADFIRCDGSVTADGTHTCGVRWATYTVTLKSPVTVGEAQLIRRQLEAVGRNAVQLISINFDAAAFRCDGTITCNGDYTCGAVNTTIN
jgi:phage tail P2-like protein